MQIKPSLKMMNQTRSGRTVKPKKRHGEIEEPAVTPKTPAKKIDKPLKKVDKVSKCHYINRI